MYIGKVIEPNLLLSKLLSSCFEKNRLMLEKEKEDSWLNPSCALINHMIDPNMWISGGHKLPDHSTPALALQTLKSHRFLTAPNTPWTWPCPEKKPWEGQMTTVVREANAQRPTFPPALAQQKPLKLYLNGPGTHLPVPTHTSPTGGCLHTYATSCLLVQLPTVHIRMHVLSTAFSRPPMYVHILKVQMRHRASCFNVALRGTLFWSIQKMKKVKTTHRCNSHQNNNKDITF